MHSFHWQIKNGCYHFAAQFTKGFVLLVCQYFTMFGDTQNSKKLELMKNGMDKFADINTVNLFERTFFYCSKVCKNHIK